MPTSISEEIQIFERHVSQKRLKHSKKRESILNIFLNTKRHVSAEDLYQLVRRNHPEIGYTTVYRTLKLIVESGLAEKVDFDDGVKRFERKLGREYHAHFICTKCASNFEVFDANIKDLSAKLSSENKFQPQKHRLEIFGICKNCV